MKYAADPHGPNRRIADAAACRHGSVRSKLGIEEILTFEGSRYTRSSSLLSLRPERSCTIPNIMHADDVSPRLNFAIVNEIDHLPR